MVADGVVQTPTPSQTKALYDKLGIRVNSQLSITRVPIAPLIFTHIVHCYNPV